jgi:hypothetical protein
MPQVSIAGTASRSRRLSGPSAGLPRVPASVPISVISPATRTTSRTSSAQLLRRLRIRIASA